MVHIAKSTMSDIKKNEKRIWGYATSLNNLGVSSSRRVMRLAKEDKLEEVLYMWFLQKKKPRYSGEWTFTCRKSSGPSQENEFRF